ncbi:MAG: cation diffusion facilitator family transporter [Bacteroidota bacterium]|nr:cation diffusion facilitator family transporter [Bacteroidota bacterium]
MNNTELNHRENKPKNKHLAKKLIGISFTLSLLLVVVKFYAYYLTSSNAILTDALESIINVFASGFAFYSIYLSSLPKDVNHPYGHGKIEFFSAGFEGALIFFAGIFIIYQSVLNLIDPAQLENLPMGILIVGVSAVLNGAVGYILRQKGREMDSFTLIADGKHLSTDAASSIIILLGIAIIYFTGYYLLDSIISILFAFYILYNGYVLMRISIAGLMDESNPEALGRVVDVLNNSRKNNWIDVHNMRIQKYGPDLHIDCHLTLPYYFNLQEVHAELKDMEETLENNISSNVEIFIHADPCIPEKCCNYCRVKNCPVRQNPYQVDVEWNAANMALNQKHFHEII